VNVLGNLGCLPEGKEQRPVCRWPKLPFGITNHAQIHLSNRVMQEVNGKDYELSAN
jgi:hypothetical protein